MKYVSEFNETVPVCFHLQWEPELFPSDIILNAAGCMVEEILGIEL